MQQFRVWVLVGSAILLIGAVFAVYLCCGKLFDPVNRGLAPVADEYVGQTKTSIFKQYGAPTHEWNGCYGNPSGDYAKKHDGAVTVVYQRSTGLLYLSFDRVGDEWVCFSSHWMPNSSMF
jgi:hypothetical protein